MKLILSLTQEQFNVLTQMTKDNQELSKIIDVAHTDSKIRARVKEVNLRRKENKQQNTIKAV